MRYVAIEEFDDQQWHDCWRVMYDPDLAAHMGVATELVATPPTLVQFYDNITKAVQEGRFQLFAAVSDEGKYLGHAVLDKRLGEWELGVVLRDRSDWGSGIGARLAMYALRWAFEEDGAEWVVAFTQGMDLNVPRLLKRGGFRPFANMLLMDRRTFIERWGGK